MTLIDLDELKNFRFDLITTTKNTAAKNLYLM